MMTTMTKMPIVSGVLASRRNSRVTTVVFLTTCVFLAQGITRNEERKVITSWNGDNVVEDDGDDVEGVNAFTQLKAYNKKDEKKKAPEDALKPEVILEGVGIIAANWETINYEDISLSTQFNAFVEELGKTKAKAGSPKGRRQEPRWSNIQFQDALRKALKAGRSGDCGMSNYIWSWTPLSWLWSSSSESVVNKAKKLGAEVSILTGHTDALKTGESFANKYGEQFNDLVDRAMKVRTESTGVEEKINNNINNRVIPVLLLWRWVLEHPQQANTQ
ncbi:unnamed protein product [Amoebophrya sp. A25]|nr:unnamed protein product [Amoebophrya sp. A25]|eukprot:GSA25T00007235001.1